MPLQTDCHPACEHLFSSSPFLGTRTACSSSAGGTFTITVDLARGLDEDHSYCPSSEEYERYQKLEDLTEQIRQKCTDETPIRLPNSSHNNEPSPPRIWRRTTWTNPCSSLPKVAFVFFFFQYLMVAVE